MKMKETMNLTRTNEDSAKLNPVSVYWLLICGLISHWASKPVRITVSRSPGWYATPDAKSGKYLHNIMLDPPEKFTLTEYQRLKLVAWHECMHSRYTPPELARAAEKSQINVFFLNLLEDFRINRLGLKTYKGHELAQHLREKAHINTLLNPEFAKRGVVTYTQEGYAIILGVQLALYPHADPKAMEAIKRQFFYPSQFKLFEQAHKIAKEFKNRILSNLTNHKLCLKYAQKLTELLSDPNQMPVTSSSNEFMDKFIDPEIYEELSSKSLLTGEIESEFVEIARQERFDFSIEHRLESIYNLSYETIAGAYLNYEDDLFDRATLTRLLQKLNNLRHSHREHLAESGYELEPELFVLGYEKCFLDEKRSSFRDPLYLLIDCSASIMPYMTPYKKALALLCEALAKLNIKFEAVAFSDRFPSKVAGIKAFKKKFGPIERARIAALSADRTTPLGAALRFALDRCKEHGIRRIIILTDGAGTDRFEPVCRDCRKSGIRVHPIGICTLRQYEDSIRDHLTDLSTLLGNPLNFQVISRVEQLPDAVFNLLLAK